MRHALALGAAAVVGIVAGAIIGLAVHPLVGIGIGVGLFAAIATGAGISGWRRP
jgi:hypothetical protein